MAKQKIKNNKVYKIRRRSDGLFSTGGNYIRFEESLMMIMRLL